jgi:hypothetical protein
MAEVKYDAPEVSMQVIDGAAFVHMHHLILNLWKLLRGGALSKD